MSFGESTIAEELEAHKKALVESEENLGAIIRHISPSTTQVHRDRLGGVKKIEVPGDIDDIEGGSVEFSPTQERYESVGIQSQVDCLMIIGREKLPESFDRLQSRFLIETDFNDTQEYRIKEIAGLGQVKNEYVYLAVGLIVE